MVGETRQNIGAIGGVLLKPEDEPIDEPLADADLAALIECVEAEPE